VYSPLPADLPFVKENKLIQLAAYHGDIDRYARLRRPVMLKHEWAIVIHRTYHHPIFARYYSTQVAERPENKHEIKIRRAINARRIMSNDLTWLSADTPGKLLPDLIWYPEVANSSTYEKLAHMKPAMFKNCLRASIVPNNSSLWDDLLVAALKIFKSTRDSNEPEDSKLWWLANHADHVLWKEASSSPNKHFQEDITAAVPDAAEKWEVVVINSDWVLDYITASSLYSALRNRLVRLYDPVRPGANEIGPYDGMDCGVGDVDVALFLRDAISRETWKKEVEDQGDIQPPLERIWEILDSIQASSL
jgi:hypothetical protein